MNFSEASLGGLLLDLAAYVGDTMSFYTDHQFKELDPTTAVEPINVERMAQAAGIKIPGSAPSVADVTFFLRIPAIEKDGVFIPNPNTLPVIKQNTSLKTNSGVKFYLIEDLDFSRRNRTGEYTANVSRLISSGGRNYFLMNRSLNHLGCRDKIQLSETSIL